MEFTLVHEIGHFIAHHGLPGSSWSSVLDPAIGDWRRAIDGTPAARRRHELLTNPGAHSVSYLEHLLLREEL